MGVTLRHAVASDAPAIHNLFAFYAKSSPGLFCYAEETPTIHDWKVRIGAQQTYPFIVAVAAIPSSDLNDCLTPQTVFRDKSSGSGQLIEHATANELESELATLQAGSVCGFAYVGPFRARRGWEHTVENSIYVDPRCVKASQSTRGRCTTNVAARVGSNASAEQEPFSSIGQQLLGRLIEETRRAGFNAIVAVIAVDERLRAPAAGARSASGGGSSFDAAWLGARSVRLHARNGFCEVAWMPRVGFKFGAWMDCAFFILHLNPPRPRWRSCGEEQSLTPRASSSSAASQTRSAL